MMVALRILQDTVLAPTLLPDTVWDGFVGDYAPAAPSEPSNRGGLRARAPLETALLLCLMTDGRVQPGDEIPDGSDDRRGWCGDSVDPSIAPIGSRLWLLRRSALTQAVVDKAILYAREAVQPLINQGAAASADVTADADFEDDRLDLAIALFQRDGSVAASTRFSVLWGKNRGILYPLDR